MHIPKIGFEIEFTANAAVKKHDQPGKIYKPEEEIYRPDGLPWSFRLDHLYCFTERLHTFEFVTDPLVNDENAVELRMKTFMSIKSCLEKLLHVYWNRGKKTSTYSKLNDNIYGKLRYWMSKFANFFPYPYAMISLQLEEEFWSLPHAYGINGYKMIKWQLKGSDSFNADEIFFSIPCSQIFTQATIGISPDKLFTLVKQLVKIEGIGFSLFTVRMYIQMADDTFQRCNVTDEFSKSFLYLVGSYIAAGQCVNLPRKEYESIFGTLYLLWFGEHPYVQPCAKFVTNWNGLLCRNKFSAMFQSLPLKSQEYVRDNIWNIVADMLYERGGHEIFDLHFFRYGFVCHKVVPPAIPKWKRVWYTLTSERSFIDRGPIIRDWINGFLYENVDLLSQNYDDYESMGRMELDGDLWLVEMRRGPADMVAVPKETENGILEPVVYGFANLMAISELLQHIQRLSLIELKRMDIEAKYFELLGRFKSIFLRNGESELLECLVQRHAPEPLTEHSKKLYERWILMHY